MSDERQESDNLDVPEHEGSRPLSAEVLEREKAEAELRKAKAEAALAEQQLEDVRREAESWHARYTFVPAPRIIFQAIGAGIIVAVALFALYQPVMETVRTLTKAEAEKANLKADIQGYKAEIQKQENEKLSKRLAAQKAAQQQQQNQLRAQEESYTEELRKLKGQLTNTQQELTKAAGLAAKWETQLAERTVEYERLAQVSEASEAEKADYARRAVQEGERARELAEQLKTLQAEAKQVGQRAAQVQEEVDRRPFRDPLEDGGQGPQMILIPPGRFQMGSSASEPGHNSNERQHQVTITKPFALSVYEITFDEYDRFARATRRDFPDDKGWGRGQRPVINVSWRDGQAYAQWLSKQTGREYRLPTEAEWEYAARAGTSSAYSFGSDEAALVQHAWYDANSGGKTHPVGQLKSNVWGLYWGV